MLHRPPAQKTTYRLWFQSIVAYVIKMLECSGSMHVSINILVPMKIDRHQVLRTRDAPARTP